MSGKGSVPRPLSVSNEEYSKRWDAIFQRDIKAEEDDKAFYEEAERIQREQALKKLHDDNERLRFYSNQ
jgi:rubrerythrin